MSESFVDLTYRGLSLGRRVKLTQVRPSTGYLEVPAPMPVGTTIAVQTDEGVTFDALVTAIHEQVGGSDRHPGMTIKPNASAEGWWKSRVTLPEEVAAPAPPAVPSRAKPITVRPRTNTVVEDTPAGAAAAPSAAAPVTSPPAPAAPVDPTLAAIAAASQTIEQAGGADGKTIVMAAIDPDAIEPEAPVRVTGEHEVIDDGKKTTMMDAVDLSALGLEVRDSGAIPVQTVADESSGVVDGNGNGDDEPPPRPSQPNVGGSVKKRKKRNR